MMMKTNSFGQMSAKVGIACGAALFFTSILALADDFQRIENESSAAFAPKVFTEKWTNYKEPSVSLRIASADGKTTIQVKDEGGEKPAFALFFRSESGAIHTAAVHVVVHDRLTTFNTASVVTLRGVRYLPDAKWAKIAGVIFDGKDPLQKGWDAAKPLEPPK